MKKFLTRRVSNKHTGFTLVELLVVIGIIAILAAVTMGVAVNVINTAKKVKAQNTIQQIQTAALSYYTEYSIYPTPSGVSTDWMLSDQDVATSGGSATWGSLIECLSGQIQPYNGQAATQTIFGNSRQIAFLTMKATDVGNGTTGHTDAPLNPLPPTAASAAASKYFNIAVDGDYDGVIGATTEAVSAGWLPNFSTVTSGSAPPSTGSSTAGVALWANCNQGSTISSNWYVHTY
jgi:prepilin-type N-terminal cleavage/methylation domain-containing protein